MLSPQLRRKVHDLWSLFWSSGLSNPLVAIEQITYLLFIRQLESLDRSRVAQNKTSIYVRQQGDATDFEKCRWSYIRQNPSFQLLNDTVFPWLRGLEERLVIQEDLSDNEVGMLVSDGRIEEIEIAAASSAYDPVRKISGRLSDAYFVLDINKSDTLKKAVALIDELFRALDTRSVNSDIMGDIFEYLLEEVKESGKNGQFRTPRHVIRFMVQLLQPALGETVLDPACGSGGFLLNTLMQWKADNTDPEVLRLEWDGTPHNTEKYVWPGGQTFNLNSLFHGYDNDRTMVRIAWMNLILHGLESPEIYQLDSLSKRLLPEESNSSDNILANPPFTGSVDEGDLSEIRERFPRHGRANTPITTKSELLFVWLMLDLLKIGGRTAVIVPDGVLFGSTNAHRALRRELLFENTLQAVVSLPANMFQPYSGVKTSILLFQKRKTPGQPVLPGEDPRTREVWFYEVTDEAFTLDQKRKARYHEDNDLWDALKKFDFWNRYLQGNPDPTKGETLVSLRAAAVSTNYFQPDYWEERWRSVDEDFLRIFPENQGDKGHTFALHELWPRDFPFDPSDSRGARQYDDAILARVRPKFEAAYLRLVQLSFRSAQGSRLKADKGITAAEKNAREVRTKLIKKAREEGILDRDFEQHGLNALNGLLQEMSGKMGAWVADTLIANPLPLEADVDQIVETLGRELKEFAKLDGYNVWLRSNETKERTGKRVASEDEEVSRQPNLLSWIVPVREWAELESWGKDPATGQSIARPTHRDGIIDPEYLIWLRNTLQIYDDDATVKTEYREERLHPDCLEALDLNLSAGRHKPFVFDAGQHRPPAELIAELQAIHGDVQERLKKLLNMVQS